MWGDVKRKSRRPVESIVLPSGVVPSLLADIRDFINSEDWYRKAGIPHRMGFLLHGPPGTGKSELIVFNWMLLLICLKLPLYMLLQVS